MIDTVWYYIYDFFGFDNSLLVDEILSEILPCLFPVALFIMAFLPLKLFFKIIWG